MKRREFISSALCVIGNTLLPTATWAKSQSDVHFYMPDESSQHTRTWMAFVANDYIWAKRQIPEVKKNLALIANTIAKYEPVSVLVSPRDYQEAAKLMNIQNSPYPISLVEFDVDDLWLRDTAPTFVKNAQGEKVAINFNFNGWGNKQEHALDKQVASFIAKQSNVKSYQSALVLEGGCFEIDGEGTAILTESCVINDNRNPLLNKIEIENELKRLLGLKKIIWLQGIKGKDITDGHTDFYVRFIRPGHVVVSRDNDETSFDYQVTRKNIEILEQSTDAQGRTLQIDILDTPSKINERFGVRNFAAGYVGYYVCNGAVIAQKFGDDITDQHCKTVLQKAFPDRVIEQISIDGIASGGGSIHCTTQQEI